MPIRERGLSTAGRANSKRTILIIDDDASLASFLSRYLEKFGFELVHAGRAEDGLRALCKLKPEAVLLDITLPGISGLDACREIRKQSKVPILIISALGESPDRVVGLELGADDYLTKPFEPRELAARLEAVLRRSGASTSDDDELDVGDLHISRSRRSATLQGGELALSDSEFALLALMAARPGHVFSRDDLMNELRGIDWDAYNRSVDLLVSRLRRKLKDDPKQPRFLRTVRGSGYTFLPQADAKRKVS